MRRSNTFLTTRTVALGGVLLVACSCVALAPETVARGDERVEIAETGCFGSCPVYEVSIDKTGRVAYTGRRYVAVVGERTTMVAPSSFRAVTDLLKPWRPDRPGAVSVSFGTGTKQLPCDDYATDGGEFVVTWFSTGGTRRLVLDRGCRSPETAAFKTKVREGLALLPSTAWAAQRDR